MRNTSILLLLFLGLAATTNAQRTYDPHASDPDKFSMGIGVGLDYGGIGLNYTLYPQENIGIFGGVGYALAGLGYNFGVKLRTNPSRATPFVMFMYGYNAAVVVTNAPFGSNFNKLFYGPSAAIGVDLKSRKGGGYWSLAMTIPFRSPDVNNYIDDLTTNDNVSFSNKPSPVGFSIGYKFILDSH
jgi:hypothetical protein